MQGVSGRQAERQSAAQLLLLSGQAAPKWDSQTWPGQRRPSTHHVSIFHSKTSQDTKYIDMKMIPALGSFSSRY